ncbi:MAG: PhzF family phenazine biosynthesis protein [Candidatus Eremiobacteraeota bacterium]|nr:PhzF family phenazine biosynthesis protein [Candidatus Eremiobacteraeota bacterium]
MRHLPNSYEYVSLDVFTSEPFKGNPLAVVPKANGLSDAAMQSIANEFNLSETVFLFPPDATGALAKARIFTPKRELPFAGHPTIGAAAVLAERDESLEGFVIEEKVGRVPIDLERTAGALRLWLTTPPVAFYETLDPAFCARLLGLTVGEIRHEVAPQFASAGSPLLFVCLQSSEAVDRAAIQQQYLCEALGSVNSVGTFVFAMKHRTTESFDVYSRMFAPQTGVPEDPATGGATGPLAAYMMKHGLLPTDQSVDFTSEQGTQMGRQSILYVRTNAESGEIKVGGSTVTIARGVLTAPQSVGPTEP